MTDTNERPRQPARNYRTYALDRIFRSVRAVESKTRHYSDRVVNTYTSKSIQHCMYAPSSMEQEQFCKGHFYGPHYGEGPDGRTDDSLD